MLSQARRRVFGATHSVRYVVHFRFRGQRLFIRNAEGESCPDGYGLGCQGGGRGGAGELWAVHHACGCRAVSWYLEQHLRAGKALMGSTRSEERRVGKEGGSTCRSRWSAAH